MSHFRDPQRSATRLRFESLESRQMLASVQDIAPVVVTADTSEKPQSKVWQHADAWWTAFSVADGTYIFRLNGSSWIRDLKLSSQINVQPDVEVDGDIVHILLENAGETQLASAAYQVDANGGPGSYGIWNQRPSLTDIELPGIETATIEVDSTGRMWIAYVQLFPGNRGEVRVQYADAPYSTFGPAVTLAAQIPGDDIAAITALPNQQVGVFWSNQRMKQFGFRTHTDGNDAADWSADEVPAADSTFAGVADDHINLAVAADSTLYAAIKTGFDRDEYPHLGLLVRRPNGTWDPVIYNVDHDGSRPIAQLVQNDTALLFIYRDLNYAGPIMFRVCDVVTLACGEEQTLIDGDPDVNNPSSTESGVGDELVVISATDKHPKTMYGAVISLNEQHSIIGDSNRDGVFDAADLTFVFAAGKYNDGIPNNASFEEGDWNEDGDFDEQDIVAAFIVGNYVAGASPATHQIAAAIDEVHANEYQRVAYVVS